MCWGSVNMTLIDLIKVMEPDTPIQINGSVGEVLVQGDVDDALLYLPTEALEQWTIRSVWMSKMYNCIMIEIERTR